MDENVSKKTILRVDKTTSFGEQNVKIKNRSHFCQQFKECLYNISKT